MIYLEKQIYFLHYLQQARSPLLDSILRILNHFDTMSFYIGLVCLIWLAVSWKWGVRLGFLLVVNGIVNTAAKLFFGSPRPCVFDPTLALVGIDGCGFPSGGAQTAFLFGALLAHYWKSRWAWPIAIGYTLLISASRMLLGVHFPLDVLGGWVFGLLVATAFVYAVRPAERMVAREPGKMLTLLIAMTGLVYALGLERFRFFFGTALVFSLILYLVEKKGRSRERPSNKKD